jgi:hypothetical protein
MASPHPAESTASSRKGDVLTLQGGARVHKLGRNGKWISRDVYLALDCQSLFWTGKRGKKSFLLAMCTVSEEKLLRTPRGVESNSTSIRVEAKPNGWTKEQSKVPGVDFPVPKARTLHLIIPDNALEKKWSGLLAELVDRKAASSYIDDDQIFMAMVSAWQVLCRRAFFVFRWHEGT